MPLISWALKARNLFLSFFFQAEDGIRDAQESRGLGDVYKRQILSRSNKVELLTLKKSFVLPGRYSICTFKDWKNPEICYDTSTAV